MNKLSTFIAWRSWGLVRYNSVWQNVAALFYVGLARRCFGLDYIRDVLLFLVFSLVGTACGYLVNDFADVELDRRAGKPNVFHGIGRARAALVVVAVFALMMVCGLPFVRRPGFLPLWAAWALGYRRKLTLPLKPIKQIERAEDLLVKQIQKEIWNLEVEDKKKVELVEKCGELEFRLSEGSDEFIQLEAFLAFVVLVGSK